MLDPINFIGQFPIWLFPVAFIIASFLGSHHCAVMCGAIVLTATGTKKFQMRYHLARLFAYWMILAVVFSLGKAFLTASASKTFLLVSSLILVFMLVYQGVSLLVQKKQYFKKLNKIYSVIYLMQKKVRLSGVSKSSQQLLLGFLNGLLPCGWIYLFVVATVTFKLSFIFSVILIGFFWLGTLPVFAMFPIVLQRFAFLRTNSFQKFFGFGCLFLAITTLTWRVAPLIYTTVTQQVSCH